ncbi:restriction endonuclease subunit R [Thioalkalivibrio versutus]|uniref:Restriction endonuclease subunit R n=1 Tax=Thioalkalivibrio versutus TaxID=106634 RepID=A0A0G3G260_9GAMM|nr:DEAD/DEAH box helicase family protein [Thioalkalivibrio versutus]AKJ94484.1 restriction endonuclease subunit R [Thioalkalivibrio versutus]
MNEAGLNEADTRAELIDPALKEAGWGVVEASRVRREVITLGRLQGGGKRARQDIADYVLIYRGQKLAVVEAKKRSLPVTEGLAQAKRYAERLQARFAYATNGDGIYRVDMATGAEGPVEAWPAPDELWAETFGAGGGVQDTWRERFGAVPFEDKGGFWQARYYQHNAINQALEAVAAGRDRILLTLATGTGKTAIAFQIAWKLFHARWSLAARDAGTPGRQPRILFLADRNILANQAFNDFSAFPEDALVRIDPEVIRKKGRVPKNGNVFFTIFQTFMTGRDAEGHSAPNFGDYPPDFFDFIIIDECHRGGANDESNWRGILEYFRPAVQLGLTATPKRTHNADTYAYFGEPVYIYSLKEGINDGFLTPFKVRQIATTLDDYVYTADDEIIEGEVEQGRRYTEEDFNRVIEIQERERYRVKLFMEQIDPREKTLVFCATQEHALAVRDLINQFKTSTDPHYCERVTANDGKEGERFLKMFQDNEKTIPTILTTSQKLSTGVDARNVRNIVLMRPVNSMIEFKQIIGRGTRLFEGKDYFTIHDFVKAYEHFNDPEWDGEPLPPEPCEQCGNTPCSCTTEPPQPCPVCGERPCVCEKEPPEPCEVCGERPCICEKRPKVKIRLADGKERTIQHMSATSFWGPDGKPISAAEFIQRLFGDLPELFQDEDELRRLWGRPDTREKLLEGLEEKGYGTQQLAEVGKLIEAENSDLYDVLAYIAFNMAPVTRAERVDAHKERIFRGHDYRQQEFLRFVLDHYVAQGVSELDTAKLPQLIELKYHSLGDAVHELGPVSSIREVFVDFQQYLY